MARKGMIEPFQEEQLRPAGAISWGVGSYGYDIRVADEFMALNPASCPSVLDPKEMPPELFVHFRARVCIIPPGSFVLARSVEYLRIPRDVLVLCLGKSTYARAGVLVNITPLEPEWEGHITMELANTSHLPVKIYAQEGIAQLVFLKAEEPCQVSYKDKAGKYQAQRGITLPRGG